MYPTYENLVRKNRAIKNLPLFITLSGSFICIFINFFTHKPGDVLWSLIVTASTAFGSIIYYVVTEYMRHGERILYSYASLSLLVIIINFLTDNHFWSTDYVFPFLTLATVLYLTVLAIRSKRMFSEYFGFILTVTLIGLSSVIFFFLGFNNSGWGGFISSLVSVILSLGLYLFAERNLKEEIKKRFHR